MFAQILKQVMILETARPAASLPGRLNGLFHRLQAAGDARRAGEIEDMIWALWASHAEPGVERRLERAVQALAARRLSEAEHLLDQLTADHPNFAEAWNKRATLYFILDRDLESVADIGRTLDLEPRHFGALAGLGQICLRHGEAAGALLAFDAALKLNPHLAGVKAALKGLQGRFSKTIH